MPVDRLDPKWVYDFTTANRRLPTYRDYQQQAGTNPQQVTWAQTLTNIQQPAQQAPTPNTSFSQQDTTPPAPTAAGESSPWDKWYGRYGPSGVGTTGRRWEWSDEIEGMQGGQGAQNLFGSFLEANVGGAPKLSQALQNQFDNVYRRYLTEKLDKEASPEWKDQKDYGWHNYLSDLGPAGLSRLSAALTPEQRGETPWAYGTRQKVQYR